MRNTRADLFRDVKRSVLEGFGFEVYIRHLSEDAEWEAGYRSLE